MCTGVPLGTSIALTVEEQLDYLELGIKRKKIYFQEIPLYKIEKAFSSFNCSFMDILNYSDI